MYLSLSPSLSLGQQLRQRLSTSQRFAIANHLSSLRLELISELAGAKYDPKMFCPACKHELTHQEILHGYNTDPMDLHTCCPKCKHSFIAKLVSGGLEILWYCPDQTLYALRDCFYLTPKQILGFNSSVYHSCMTHFGSLSNAFKKMGMKYTKEEKTLWHAKVQPFLGKMTDRMIAEVVGVTPALISALRRSYGIPRFSKMELADEIS